VAPVRVLWVIKGLGPGGAERLLVSLAEALSGEDMELACAYLLPWKSHLRAALQSAGVEVECLDVRSEADPRWLKRLAAFVRRFDPDVVHFHSPLIAGIARPLVRAGGLRQRPRTMTSEHNVFSSYAVPTRLFDRATWRIDDVHLAVTDEARASLPKQLRAETEVVVHGVPLPSVTARLDRRNEMRRMLGFGSKEVVVGTVANYRAQKDYPTLLEAARRALSLDERIRFVAVGQGPLESEIVRLHQALGLGERFLLTGYRDDAIDILSACDVFCLSSRHEGYPVAMMEALALGLPVVATRVGGLAEAIRDGCEGVLVPAGDVEQLAEALVSLARADELRAKYSVAARQRSRLFDIRRAGSRHVEIYRSLRSG
jgi:glycosyltransferase involved in cell wall biosynthesis